MKAVLLALVLTGCGCSTLPTHDALRATTLRLEFADGALCSGTAIAPDVILTAEHCVDATLKTVDGHPVRVTGLGKSEPRDMATIRVSGLRFESWSRIGRPAKQGDRVRWWGNPLGMPDMYRQGYVSRVGKGQLIVDATICKGDSGSGLFNDSGHLVGVVSAMSDRNGCTFMLAGAL
jgi:V8-like Glu-specific endopeptidase